MYFYMSGKINPTQLELNIFRTNLFKTVTGEIRSSEIIADQRDIGFSDYIWDAIKEKLANKNAVNREE